ncbi:hydroxyacyl-thioester dehydratase HTD2 [Sugiyamaella lignohabitans]|uniref:Hydroxyacyl-thioester dehydratase HTD2 n=1 Tax=Sugiyamaella lignohabitans TaxID=796027 RepID=A0A167CXA0_9ASCO|nr:hydroxyacyl-thioester dehydratase HTD2 [Sugiyamaella lignohabitans]ANB12219.1 hydroxyacyl-thioester dehydratase HTD2 [Sugiyamaella lignohabitans]
MVFLKVARQLAPVSGFSARSARFLATAAPTSAIQLSSQGPWKYLDTISPNQSRKLDASLASYLPGVELVPPTGGPAESLPLGQVLPAGSHLVFFNPDTPENQLSSDGYEDFQSPGPRFPNRMWFGGSVEFSKSPLIIGTESTCVESVKSVDHSVKPGLPDTERVSVTLERLLYNNRNPKSTDNFSVREVRTLIYFTEEAGKDRDKIFSRFLQPPANPAYSHSFTPSPVLLFRYSALTFNSHRIHYDPRYSSDVEQLPNVLVHGPLTVTLLLRWLESSVLKDTGKSVKSFTYRSLLPLFVDDELTLCASRINHETNSLEVWIQDYRGSLSVKGAVTLH